MHSKAEGFSTCLNVEAVQKSICLNATGIDLEPLLFLFGELGVHQ